MGYRGIKRQRLCLGSVKLRLVGIALSREEAEKQQRIIDYVTKLLKGPTIAQILDIAPQEGDCGCGGS